jgi:hypothetical protein
MSRFFTFENEPTEEEGFYQPPESPPDMVPNPNPAVTSYSAVTINGKLVKLGTEIQGIADSSGKLLAQRTILNMLKCKRCQNLIRHPMALGGECSSCHEAICGGCMKFRCQATGCNAVVCLSCQQIQERKYWREGTGFWDHGSWYVQQIIVCRSHARFTGKEKMVLGAILAAAVIALSNRE